MNLYFIFNFLSWFHDIYNFNFSSLVFSFFNFLKIMENAYLSKHFNFISVYNDLFRNFNYYKCLYSDASKHFKMIFKRFLKYVS